MAKILIVHGIGNQYMGEMELHREWYPALCDGLSRAGCTRLPEEIDCFCTFYGDLFRPGSPLGPVRPMVEEDLEEIGEDEAMLLDAVWKSAAEIEPEVPGPNEYEDTLLWAPRLAERALNALTKSKYLAYLEPLLFFGDLKQVTEYLSNREMRTAILNRVLPHISPETKVVIGHSLGSVVAYEALCEQREPVSALITLGSPLGVRNVVFDRLTPRPDGPGLASWPGAVKHWTNIAASGDIVAVQKALAPLFGDRVEDVLIDNGWDAHSSARYLNERQAGAAVARALSD